MKKKVAEQSEQMIYRQVKHTCTHEDSFLPSFLAQPCRTINKLPLSFYQLSLSDAAVDPRSSVCEPCTLYSTSPAGSDNVTIFSASSLTMHLFLTQSL